MSVTLTYSCTFRVNHRQAYLRTFSRSITLTDGSGPTPGLVVATPAGADIDFSLLTNARMAFVYNLDETSAVEIGIWNADQSEFYPFMRLQPGEAYPWPMSPNMLEEYATGTGTGLTGQNNTVRAKSMTAANANLIIDAFNG